MVAVAYAVLVLFGGRSLDGWITLAGQWSVADGAMVIREAPTSLRSSYESDQFTLTFEYRGASRGAPRLAIHSAVNTGGLELLLTPAGVRIPNAPPTTARPVPDDEWIRVAVDVTPGAVRATSTRENGEFLGEPAVARIDPPSRGFLRFLAAEPGLQLRRVTAREPGFIPLFDGRSLEGWEIMYPKNPDDPGWVMDDGIVVCRGRRSGWLRTLRTHDNFILRLEYQLPPRGNSGVFLRAPIEGRVSRIGLEIQLLDDRAFAGRLSPAQYTGSIYDGIAPEVRVPAPADQWNAVEIVCDGRRVRTILNAVQLYDARLDDSAKDVNRDKRPLATRRAVGFIGLQDHSTPVKFRNVRIRTLP